MIITTRSRMRRILKDNPRFKEGYPGDENHYGLKLPIGEEYIGTYINPDESICKYIHISSNGLWADESNSIKFIPFIEIETSRAPHDKENGSIITIEYKDKTKDYLSVLGADGKFRDVYEFSRFIDRVVMDRANERAKKDNE